MRKERRKQTRNRNTHTVGVVWCGVSVACAGVACVGQCVVLCACMRGACLTVVRVRRGGQRDRAARTHARTHTLCCPLPGCVSA